MQRIRFALSCLFLLAGSCVLTGNAEQEKQQANKDSTKTTSELDGVWELTSRYRRQEDGLPKFPTFKSVMINHGTDSYWIQPIRLGSMVIPHKMTLNAGGRRGAVDFISVDDNRTVHGLFAVTKDEFKFCFRADRKTLIRPEKLSPLPDDCILYTFKRLAVTSDSSKAPPKFDKRIAGIWETVRFESNGEILEMKDFDSSFREKEMALFIQGDLCMMMTTEINDVKVLRTWLQLKVKDGVQVIDIKYPDNQIVPAIYGLTGDRLSICWNPNGPRPDQFLTEKDDGRTLIRFRRVGSTGSTMKEILLQPPTLPPFPAP